MMPVPLRAENISKTFILHHQNSARLPVFDKVNLQVASGECVALNGRSGSGKSTLLRSLYGNYLPDCGQIWVRHHGETVDIVSADARYILALRRQTIGWVSQFLHVIPRVSTLEIVIQPLLERGLARSQSLKRAAELLTRLHVPERLWPLAPATFSGGEQQRINIARGLIADYPVLLLDEPTASLDKENRNVVVQLINEAKARGSAIVGIFHDEEVRRAVAGRHYDMPTEAATEGGKDDH